MTEPRPVSMTEEQRSLACRVAGHVDGMPSARGHLLLNLKGDALSMCSWGHSSSCGTVACIAGWTVFLCDGPEAISVDPDVRIFDVSVRACELLGLGSSAGSPGMDLFVWGPGSVGLELEEVTGTMAARVLRHLADHQELDWHRALTEEEWAARAESARHADPTVADWLQVFRAQSGVAEENTHG